MSLKSSQRRTVVPIVYSTWYVTGTLPLTRSLSTSPVANAPLPSGLKVARVSADRPAGRTSASGDASMVATIFSSLLSAGVSGMLSLLHAARASVAVRVISCIVFIIYPFSKFIFFLISVRGTFTDCSLNYLLIVGQLSSASCPTAWWFAARDTTFSTVSSSCGFRRLNEVYPFLAQPTTSI